MSRKNDNDALIVIGFIVLILVGFWLYRQITDFAAFAHLNFDTAAALLRNLAILIVFACGAAYLGAWQYVKAYIPAFLGLAIVPALQFWSMGHIIPEYSDFAVNTEPDWYGRTWVHVVAFLALIAAGFYWQNRE